MGIGNAARMKSVTMLIAEVRYQPIVSAVVIVTDILTDVHITQRSQSRRREADCLDRRSIPQDIQGPALKEDGEKACERVHHEEHNRSIQEAPVRRGRYYTQEEESN